MGDFFVRRPIVAMVMAIFMVIIGVVFLSGLPMEQYPDITPPIVEVRAKYTGADAVSVEQSVATPLEQQLNGVDNMIYMKSTNANDGSMTIQVSFEFGSDDTYKEAGWYLASVKVGSESPVATDSRSWSSLKSIYR